MTTPQRFFNKVYREFVYRKRPPAMKDGKCVYIDPNNHNCRCAIGINMPIKVALEAQIVNTPFSGMNHSSLSPILEEWWNKQNFGPTEAYSLLQRIHDSCAEHESTFHVNIERKLNVFARMYSLTVPKK